MTFQKIREVANMHVQHLQNLGVLIRMMSGNENFSSDSVFARKQMLGHAHYLVALSIPMLLAQSEKMIDCTSCKEHHGKIGRHLGSAQTLMWTAGLYTLDQLKEFNRSDK